MRDAGRHIEHVAGMHRPLGRVPDVRLAVGLNHQAVGPRRRGPFRDDPQISRRLVRLRRIARQDDAHVRADVGRPVEDARVDALERLVLLPPRLDVGGAPEHRLVGGEAGHRRRAPAASTALTREVRPVDAEETGRDGGDEHVGPHSRHSLLEGRSTLGMRVERA